MVDMFNIGSSGFKQNSYGNIQKIGMTPNGRTVYRVIDSNGEETGKLSVPQTESDKFESAYNTMNKKHCISASYGNTAIC